MAVVNKVKNFDLQGILPGASYIIDDITAYSDYQFLITLESDQPFGVYNLIQGVDIFSSLVSIDYNGTPGTDASFCIGSPLTVGNITYSLSLAKGNLQFSIDSVSNQFSAAADGRMYGGAVDAEKYSDYKNNIDVSINTGADVRAAGGNRVAIEKEFAEFSGDINVSIGGAGMVYKEITCGGEHVIEGAVSRNGTTNLTVTDGTFSKAVAGGLLMVRAATDPLKTYVGKSQDINFNISGGTFNNRVFGGNMTNRTSDSGLTVVHGDINLTIDATSNKLSFDRDIIAGSSGYGVVYGNTTVTLKGSGDNLSFSGVLSGGSEGAIYVTSAGVRSALSFVEGDRNLVIDGFTGDFDGKVVMFNRIEAAGNTAINFTNTASNFAEIEAWDIEFGSTISGVSGSNFFTGDSLDFDLTGFSGTEWKVMSGTSGVFESLDSAKNVTIGGVDAEWNGTAWVAGSSELAVKDGNLVITVSGTPADNTVEPGDSGDDYITASTPTVAETVYGGSNSADAYKDAIDFSIDTGSTVRVAGGNGVYLPGEFIDFSGDINVSIGGAGMVYKEIVCGGDQVIDGAVSRNGDINLTVTDGTFSKAVAGGLLMVRAAADPLKNYVGKSQNINFNISGGTFNNRVFGGNMTNRTSDSGLTVVHGDINLTIDATSNELSFARDIIAGSSGYGVVYGDTTVTLKGSGDNLSFSGVLSGGSEGAIYVTSAGVRSALSFVEGDRNLVIDGFTGDFDGKVVMFNRIEAADKTKINFTNTASNFAEIEAWDIEFGSTISGVSGSNFFTDDSLDFDLTGFSGTEWEIMSGTSGTFESLGSAAEVTISGSSAAWMADNAAWETDVYALKVNENNDKLIIAKK